MEKSKEKTESVFKKWTKLVDPKIKEILNVSVDKKTQELVNYQMTTGGKRLRPVLAIASCLCCGGRIKDILYPAAGLEILHNCTLVYDDIIDNSNKRRGKPTVWSRYGKSITECIGLDYAAAIFQAANKSKYPVGVSEIFARTLKEIVDGQILDILFEQSGRESERYITKNRFQRITQNNYLKMVSKKTASLIRACCETGAVSAGAKANEVKALKGYGFNLGIAFQIRDDILDIFGKEKEFGKKIGKDIQERKLGNIVIFYALEELKSVKEKNKLLAILKKNRVEGKDIKKALKLINKTKAQEKSLFLGVKYVKKAKETLRYLQENEWSKFLADLADFVIKRNK
jgi:geranylgeranyl diphosphate synthase, type I